MDRDWVWDQIADHDSYEIDVVADAIFQAHEEDKWDALKELDRAWQETVDTLQAQAAAAGDWIEAAQEIAEPHELTEGLSPTERIDVCLKLRQALSSAPKAVWEGQAIAEHNDYSALRVEHTVLRIIGHGAVAIKGKHFCEDGQQVNLFVMECPRPPEQGQNSEQSSGGTLQAGSKADGVDGEEG